MMQKKTNKMSLQEVDFYILCQIIIREGASHSLYRDETIFVGDFGAFDTPETHIRHVQNLIMIAEMEYAS